MKILPNPSIQGFSGKMSSWVYRQVEGQTIAAAIPDPRPDAPSTAQLAQRDRFKQARAYARRIMDDPRKREEYIRLGQAARRQPDKILTSDFLTPPVITRVDLSEYHGRPGDPIHVLAFDDIEVVSVDVALQTANGVALEAGAASKDHGVWVYRATTAAPAGERIVITVTAKDRPGNATTAVAKTE